MPDGPLSHSAFDSEVFGVAFLRVTEPDLVAIARGIDALEYDRFIVDAKLPAGDTLIVSALADMGFHKASTLVEFHGAPDAGAVAAPEVETTLSLAPEDLDAHAAGFRFQRFRQDRRIPEAGSIELMRRWIANSLAGRRETLAIGRNFCTFGVFDGTLSIDLLSCLDARQGVAGKLLEAVHATAQTRGCGEVRVITEAENVGAMRSYFRAGFLPDRAWSAMHLVRN